MGFLIAAGKWYTPLMYSFTQSLIIIISICWGIWNWETNGFFGKLFGILLLAVGVALFMRWDRQMWE